MPMSKKQSSGNSENELQIKKEKFIEKLKTIYKEEVDEVIKSIEVEKPTVFRVNTLKAEPEKVLNKLNEAGFEILPALLNNSYYIKNSEKRLSDTPEFKNGEIYIQRLSSMLPVFELDPKPGEKILDLCAAPGSKTSQIAEISNNQSKITAVENNRSRFFALQKNLENLGVKNVQLLMEDGSFIDRNHPQLLEYFDKVLIDAPCTNEGLICFCNPNSLKMWNKKNAIRLAKLQKRLLSAGLKMLRPGGSAVYSTCTFSVEENEEVVGWVLKNFPYISLIEQKRVIPDHLYSGFYFAKLLKQS